MCISQTLKEESPVSFLYNIQTDVETYNLDVEFSKLQNEPRIEIIDNDTVEVYDPIIGELFNVSININRMGTWTAIDNGDSIWQMQINVHTGDYMMLIFDDFYLPQGSKLYVYSADKNYVLGAYTDENNYSSGKFTTAPLKTNSLIIEYYKPFHVKEQAALNVKSVGLIDKSFTEELTRNLGNSGACMINAMCPEYDNWCDQRRSVALIIRVFSEDKQLRWCTGSMVTNEKQDGKPFFLTAFHCLDFNGSGSIGQSEQDEVANWVFVFHYQSPNCENPTTDPPLVYSISGATFIRGKGHSSAGGTDYALLQLSQKPPKNYNVYYSGWSNDKDDMSETGVCIHHPAGDIKKISTWEKVTSEKLNFWKVKWTKGSTQGGSSGSPLFNSSGYLMGQNMSSNQQTVCSNVKRDFFGRFDRSWHDYGLCYELNPNGTHSGNYEEFLVSMPGNETCKQNWNFNNCNDLHTSDNVSFLLPNSMGSRQYDGVYNAKNKITAENTIIQSGSDKKVVFEAGNSIVLKSGFHATLGSKFIAKIGDCEMGCNHGQIADEEYSVMVVNNSEDAIAKVNMNNSIPENNENTCEFLIYPNPNHGTFSIKLSNENRELQKIIIADARGYVVYNNNDHKIVTNKIQLANPVSGIYIISLYFKNKLLTSKFTVL